MSLLDIDERFITEFKYKLDKLLIFMEKDLTSRQKIYLEHINKLIEEIEIKIDDLILDVRTTSDNISPEILEEMNEYVINQMVKDKFLPYMLVYRMQLKQQREREHISNTPPDTPTDVLNDSPQDTPTYEPTEEPFDAPHEVTIEEINDINQQNDF